MIFYLHWIQFYFLKLTDEIEVQNIIMFLNPLTAIRANSINAKILKLLIIDVSSQLTGLFDISFSHGVFPLILKTPKIILIYKKRI